MTDEAIKVVLVDDEYLERNLLKNCIDWNRLNMHVVGEAQDSAEALDLVHRCNPDLIFTDIQMPGEDGISLSETVLRENPGIKIVVLTGFDTFDYAQRSIKAGVTDYLLKPINGEEVLKTVSGIREQINRERQESEEYRSLRRQLRENLPYLRERFFGELLSGAAGDGSLEERMEILGIRFSSDSFQTAVFETVPKDALPDEEFRFLLNLQILNSLTDSFRSKSGVFVFQNTTSRIVILNNDESLDLYDECVALRERLAKEFSCSVCVGLGGLKRGAENICVSFREALEAIRYRVAVGNDAVILYDSIRFPARDAEPCKEDLYGQLDFFLRTGLADKVDETIDRIFDTVDLQSEAAVKTIRMTALNVSLAFFRAMTEAGLDPSEVYREEVRANGRIFQLSTLPDIKSFLKDTARMCTDSLNRRQSSRIVNLIDDMKQYVGENYADSSLTLNEVARKFFFNPSYLSRTFKKKAGISFVEYLTGVRMEKAVELIKAGNGKAFEIAEAVGIPDSNYFSTCFKKYTGISISDYRRALGLETAAESRRERMVPLGKRT